MRRLRFFAFALALAALVTALWVRVSGGFRVSIAGFVLTAHDPIRLLVVALVGFALFFVLGGSLRSLARAFVGILRDHRFAIVIALAVAVGASSVVFSTAAVGGADSYGYASEADLWLRGDLKVSQPWADEVPWPSRQWTFTPIGYTPSRQKDEASVIVPIYPPGLPMLLAAGKWIGGQEGMFWITPIAGLLLVLLTYGIGCRLGDPNGGLIAAWLVATSPIVVMLSLQPMSDIPAATAWAMAVYALLGRGRWRALAAGLAAGLALLIRPNTAVVLMAFAVWFAIEFARGLRRRTFSIRDGLLFAIGLAPGVITAGWANAYLYGSPTTSGYGDVGWMFSTTHVWPNAVNYLRWLVDAETPLALAFVAILLPFRWLWPRLEHRAPLVLMSVFVLSLWVFYLWYLPFDAWWYLRFLLPAWPFVMIGVAAAVMAVVRRLPVEAAAIVALLLAVFGVREMIFAKDHFAFDLWKSDRHYVSVAKLVREATGPASVILSMQESGSVRYYGGRVSMRYDQLDPAWLDRAVTWMSAHGAHPYLLADEWELPAIRERFSGQATLKALDEPAMLTYTGPATVQLFDLAPSRDRQSAGRTFFETDEHLRSVVPVRLPHFAFKAAQ